MAAVNGSGAPVPPSSSLARKKLMGYVGFANLPNQVHRKSVRKGFNFTCMVVGKFYSSYYFLYLMLAFRGVWSRKIYID